MKQKSDLLRARITFGRRKRGKAKKLKGPKDKKMSKYRGQGK